MKTHEHSRPDCSTFVHVHGSHFGDLTRQHVTMVPNPPPLLIGQLEGTNLALYTSRSFHNHGSKAARELPRAFKATYDSYIERVIRLHLEPLISGVLVFHNHAFAPGQAAGIVDDSPIQFHRVTALGHGGDNMEMPVEQTDLRDHALIEFTPLSIGHLAHVPTPANDSLERDIAELLTGLVERPRHKPVIWYKSFLCQVASWKRTRRVVAKADFYFGELLPRVGFIVTNLATDSRAVVRFYNQRGTAEQWIKKAVGEGVASRLAGCHRFRSNEVRLWLSVIACNLGNPARWDGDWCCRKESTTGRSPACSRGW